MTPRLCADTMIDGSHSAFHYADYVRRSLIASPVMPGTRIMRFDRIFDTAPPPAPPVPPAPPTTAKGYGWDNPGTTIRFRTDATHVTALLYYNDKHTSTTARNGAGIYRVDGGAAATGAFNASVNTLVRPVELVRQPLYAQTAAAMHDYELVLPYGDSVDFQGVIVNDGATFMPVAAPTSRWLAFGDSVTQGFSASRIDKTYPYLVARKKHWQLLNMAIGGYSAHASQGAILAAQPADLITIALGTNDWQGQTPIDRFRLEMAGLIAAVRARQPHVPIHLMTPLWVADDWDIGKPRTYTLEQYRRVIRDLVRDSRDANLHVIEGPELIDPDVTYFSAVRVHPNDAGFTQMAERLAARLR